VSLLYNLGGRKSSEIVSELTNEKTCDKIFLHTCAEGHRQNRLSLHSEKRGSGNGDGCGRWADQ